MARGVRIYKWDAEDTGVQFHVFGLLPTSLALYADGETSVWPYNCESSCEDYPTWKLVYDEGDAS